VSLGRVAATVLVLTGGLSVVPVASAAEAVQDPAAVVAVEDRDAEAPCAPAEDAPADSLEDVSATTVPVPVPAAAATDAAASDDEAAPPVAHCSQNAGDNQYKDPFANAKPPSGGGDPASGQGSQSPDTSTSAPATTIAQGTADPAVTGAPGAEDAGPGLPNTGLDAGIPAWTGLALLLAGALLRRRTA
jgi:LPXTG-motif cell wall-anchored protein